MVVEEALLGRQEVRLESEQLQRKSGTSGRNPSNVILILLPKILNFLFSCSPLQAEGKGAVGHAQEASRGRN